MIELSVSERGEGTEEEEDEEDFGLGWVPSSSFDFFCIYNTVWRRLFFFLFYTIYLRDLLILLILLLFLNHHRHHRHRVITRARMSYSSVSDYPVARLDR